MLEDLASFKAGVKARLAPLEQDKSRAKFLCQKAVNTPVNAICPQSSAHLRDKLEKLQELLRGESVTIGTETVSTSMHPLYPEYVRVLLAKKFVAQGEEVISSKPEFAFCMAAVITALWVEFPDFGSLFLANLYEACPYLVPYIPPNPLQQSKEEYMALGYKYMEDDVIEEQPKFIKRMTGMARLLAAVTISALPKGQEKINHPHGLGHLWRWLASTMNMEPINDVTATLVYDVLEVSGSEMFAKFGTNFRKLLALLADGYFPKIQQVTADGCGGPVMRLENFLQKAVRSGTITAPAAALKPGFL